MMVLRGCWSIDRTVEPGGHFVGNGVLHDHAGRAFDVRRNRDAALPDGTELEGGNRYIYALRDGAIDVTFADGGNAGAHFIDLAFSPAQTACGHCNRGPTSVPA